MRKKGPEWLEEGEVDFPWLTECFVTFLVCASVPPIGLDHGCVPTQKLESPPL